MPIPLQTAPPHPSGSGWMWFLVLVGNDTGDYPWMSFTAWIPSSDPPVGSSPDVFIEHFLAGWKVQMQDVLPTNGQIIALAFFWQTALGLQQWDYNIATHTGSPVHGNIPGGCLSTRCNVLLLKKSLLSYGYRGRNWFGTVPNAYWDGQYLSPAGGIAYRTFANAYINTWTSQGVTFTPALYCPKADTMDPITYTKLKPEIRTLMRRSPRHRNWFFFVFADRWDY